MHPLVNLLMLARAPSERSVNAASGVDRTVAPARRIP